jgi:phage tail sheath gpL-like
MAVSIPQLPSGLAVPLFYAQVDNSQAGVFTVNGHRLLIGQKLAAGAAPLHEKILITSTEQAWTLFGRGSLLARMVEAYRANDSYGELYCIALADDPAGVAAVHTVTLTGPAQEAGQTNLNIGATRVRGAVADTDTATAMATALAAAINADLDLPVTATSALGVVTVTSRHKGECGNAVGLVMNLLGEVGGERLPKGTTAAIVQTVQGSGNPDITPAIAAMGDDPFDYIVMPYTDTASLNDLRDEMVSRWSALRMIYGHAYAAKVDTLGNLTALGDARNDPALTIGGVNGTPWPGFEIAAAFAGQASQSLEVDPARPIHTLVLKGGPAPKAGYTLQEKQILIDHGIAPLAPVLGGELAIVSGVTTYTKNVHGARDRSYQNITTRSNLTFQIRFLQARITQKFGRHKLADDGTRFGAGQAIVTPNIIRAELIAAYGELVALGLAENIEAFKNALIVERDLQNVDRVNILFAPDLVNELKVIGMLVQFRQQYPVAA